MKELPPPETLLGAEKYWNEETFFLLRERCQELALEDPQECLALARHAPGLAEKIALHLECPDIVQLEAYSLHANACRLVGDLTAAEQLFALAETYAAQLTPLETADFKRRMSKLRRDQKRFDESLELIGQAIQDYRQFGDLTKRDFLGNCYLTRGVTQFDRNEASLSAIDLSTALNHIDVKRSPRIYYAAVHNLAVALTYCASPDALGKALKLLKEARRKVRFRGRHMAKFKLRWLEGLICIRFGSTRLGERCLLKARDGLIELGVTYEVALISLDLTALYLVEGEPPDVIEQIARETYQLFVKSSNDEEALVPLMIWLDAAAKQELTDEIVQKVRDQVARLTKPVRIPRQPDQPFRPKATTHCGAKRPTIPIEADQ